MAQALEQLQSDIGSSLIITLAPQTIDTQYYNSGTMNGCDGNVYAEGSVDFITALACTELQSGLSATQIGIGLPASPAAAGSGYVDPSVVNNALDCLATQASCGSFTPSTSYPDIRGAMTWSINWDASNGYNFANTVAPHLASMH